MVFDLISFLIGVGAGALTGVLAGALRCLERTADVQERLLKVSQEVKRVKALPQFSPHSSMDELDHDIEEINEEIRRMYRRSTR